MLRDENCGSSRTVRSFKDVIARASARGNLPSRNFGRLLRRSTPRNDILKSNTIEVSWRCPANFKEEDHRTSATGYCERSEVISFRWASPIFAPLHDKSD